MTDRRRTVAADIGRNPARTVAHGRRVQCCRIGCGVRWWRLADACRDVRHGCGRLPLIALQTGRGRLAKRTARFRRARTWAARRTACKAVFDGLATNPAKRRGTGANGCARSPRSMLPDRLRRSMVATGAALPESLPRSMFATACRIDWRTVATSNG